MQLRASSPELKRSCSRRGVNRGSGRPTCSAHSALLSTSDAVELGDVFSVLPLAHAARQGHHYRPNEIAVSTKLLAR